MTRSSRQPGSISAPSSAGMKSFRRCLPLYLRAGLDLAFSGVRPYRIVDEGDELGLNDILRPLPHITRNGQSEEMARVSRQHMHRG